MSEEPKRTIWKFTLQLKEEQTIRIPSIHEILSVQVQGDTICLWAIVYPDEKPVDKRITICGTGHDCPFPTRAAAWCYIGTVQTGHYVWHVFSPDTKSTHCDREGRPF